MLFTAPFTTLRSPLRTAVQALLFLVAAAVPLYAQPLTIERIDPPHWYTGWEEQQKQLREVELLVEGRGLADATWTVDGVGVTITSAPTAANPRYRYVRLEVSDSAPPQRVVLRASNGSNVVTFAYPLMQRRTNLHPAAGLSVHDMVYAITVDRFANGDRTNDVVAGMQERTVNRLQPQARHGGDLAGVLQHVDYLDTLGATAVWLSPVQESNMPASSYQGYAITDHYRIDPRLGTFADYTTLVNTLHTQGKRIVMDVILNHVGSSHRLAQQPPDSAWFNWWPSFTSSNGRIASVMDPNAVWADRERMLRGWVDSTMPDINHDHPQAARYLLQYLVWWVEAVGVDALRIDRYAYADPFFMRDLMRALRTMYPRLGLLGDVQADDAVTQASFADRRSDGLDRSWLPSLTDHQLYQAWTKAVTTTPASQAGANFLYAALSADRLYDRPADMLIYLDGPRLGRHAGAIGTSMKKFTQGIVMLYTMRGIPCLYYGTEVLLNQTGDVGRIHADMSGGWPGDRTDLFQSAGRTSNQRAAIALITAMAKYRATTPALTTGQFKHCTPQDGVYAYVRYDQSTTVVVALNTEGTARPFDVARFSDLIPEDGTIVEVLTNAPVDRSKPYTIEANGVLLLQVTASTK